MKPFLAAAAAASLVILVPATATAGGGGCHGGYTPDARSSRVALQNFCMDPLVVRVPHGGTVTWTNTDDAMHNVLGPGRSWGDYQELRRGESISWRFDTDGTFPYVCTLHPGMAGAVVVGTGVRPAGLSSTSSPATRVSSSLGSATARPKAAPAREPAVSAAEPATAPTEQAASAVEPEPATPSSEAVVAAARPAQSPPPPGTAQQIAAIPASRSAPDSRNLALPAFALGGALVLAAVAFAARRTPPTRELVG